MSENKFYDFFGQELNIGDCVVFTKMGAKTIIVGLITRKTEKTVFIKKNGRNGRNEEIRQRPFDLIKINDIIDANPELFI